MDMEAMDAFLDAFLAAGADGDGRPPAPVPDVEGPGGRPEPAPLRRVPERQLPPGQPPRPAPPPVPRPEPLDGVEHERPPPPGRPRPTILCQRCATADAPEAATVMCRACGGQFLCAQCDRLCHTMAWAAHARQALAPRNPLVACERALAAIVGNAPIKRRVRRVVISHIEMAKTARLRGVPHVPSPPVYLFVGEPGVGKTTICDAVARAFVGAGMATHVTKLRKESIPHSPRAFFEQLRGRLRGGVLVVDELQNFVRCTIFSQFLVALTSKGLVDRPIVLLAGYSAPRKPNVDDYLSKTDPGLARRLTRTFVVPSFTPDMVCRLLVEKIQRSGYALGPDVSEARLRRYIRGIPPRVYDQVNGSIAEKVLATALETHAMSTFAADAADVEERLQLSRDTVRAAVSAVIADLTE
jgi:hypothetical protein